MVTADDLRLRIDEHAAAYHADPDATYESAVGIAVACAAAAVSTEVGREAQLLRDAFGTWAHHIHSYGSGGGTRESALASHDAVERALDDWLSGGRTDLLGFAERWRVEDRSVRLDWLSDPGPNRDAD